VTTTFESRKHGTTGTYRAGCRCADCRDANRLKCAQNRARRAADPAAADRAGHGKASTYINYDCRCTPCRDAHSANLRRRRAK
jgi:hypothetical protein